MTNVGWVKHENTAMKEDTSVVKAAHFLKVFSEKYQVSSVKPGFPVLYGNSCLDLQFSRSLLNALYCSTRAPPAKLF